MRMKMRIYHRYLGFFLTGIMTMYAISGSVLVFRDKDTFKTKTEITKVLPENTKAEELGEILEIRRFQIDSTINNMVYFNSGTYNLDSRTANYTLIELPYVLDKMTYLHKATSSRPLAFLNIFFAFSLLFFVISSFWMFLPETNTFKKGLYFALAGLAFALLLIFV